MNFLALLSNFGGPDLIIILLIVLVLFGAKKLPELARGMGQAVKEFQKAKDEFSDELHNAGKTDPAKPDVRAAQATVRESKMRRQAVRRAQLNLIRIKQPLRATKQIRSRFR